MTEIVKQIKSTILTLVENHKHQTVPLDQQQLVQQKKISGCMMDCGCEKCIQQGYTSDVLISDSSFLFTGAIMIRLPVSKHYKMIGHVSLNYQTLHDISLKKLIKLKCTYGGCPPGLNKLLFSLKPDEHKEEIMVNQNQMVEWFIHATRAKIYHNLKFGVPYRYFNGHLVGKLLVKNYFGGWTQKGVEIVDRIRVEGQNQIKGIKEFWTRFQIVDVGGLCLVVKFWHMFVKWEIGIPLKELSQWLAGFIRMVKD